MKLVHSVVKTLDTLFTESKAAKILFGHNFKNYSASQWKVIDKDLRLKQSFHKMCGPVSILAMFVVGVSLVAVKLL